MKLSASIYRIGARFVSILFLLTLLFSSSNGNVISLNNGNIDDIIASNELVFVNFYADWCRFSQMLTPIFEDTAKKVAEEFPEQGKVVLARVDCDREGAIGSRYQVSKYPTLKLLRYGQPIKKEYRGQRSVSAMTEFLRKQLENPVTLVTSQDQLYNLDLKKRNIIGYFDNEDNHEYKNFYRKVASLQRDDCVFYAALGAISETDRAESGNKIVFRHLGDAHDSMVYPEPLSNYDAMQQWVWEMCVPIVREITFENAEELTEEGLPFMILFHHPDDTETPIRYKKQISEELKQDMYAVNFLTADGTKFSHPLQHLGKSVADLPILAIDSFRHMYIWRHNVRNDLERPGLLKQFIVDLQTGKLHREFHQGPDPTPPSQHQLPSGDTGHVPKDSDDSAGGAPVTHPPIGQDTTPLDSLFIKLAPSKNRYTILRDEL